MFPPPLPKIAQRLAETANRDQVIEELCLQYGLHWQDAESIVVQAETDYQHKITRQQTPILLLVAFSTFSIGVLFISWNLLGVLFWFASLVSPNPISVINLFGFYADWIAALLDFSQSGNLFILGLAMTLGSQLGMKSVWLSWLESQQERTEPELPARPPTHRVEVTDKMLRYVLRQLERGESEADVVIALQAHTGIGAEEGLALVQEIVRSRGDVALTSASPAIFFSGLAAFLSGAVLVVQNVMLLFAYLRANPRGIHHTWDVLLRIRDITLYIDAHPVLALWFVFGVICFIGGYFLLRLTLFPALLRFRKSHNYAHPDE